MSFEEESVVGHFINRAREARAKYSGTPTATPVSPSQLWHDIHIDMHQKAIAGIDDERELAAFVTENNAFTFPRLVSDPECAPIAERFLEHLSRQGYPIDSLPPEYQESALAGGKVVFERNGRRLSTMFLLQLCKAMRIRRHSVGVKTVVEIGAGYGGLARTMKLAFPISTYCIVDLLDSLYFSYVFLSANFPEAKTLLVTDRSQLGDISGYDFVFVPAEFVEGLYGRDVDLVVNTCSLGEMTQAAVDQYMELIHRGLRTRYFYSMNRYGFRDPHFPADLCSSPVVLDRTWTVKAWDLWGESGFAQIEPATPPSLEILVERQLDVSQSDDVHLATARAYFNWSFAVEKRNSLWHFCLWNSIRHYPCRENLEVYLSELRAQPHFNELAHYANVERLAPQVDLGLPDGLDHGGGPFQGVSAAA